MKRIGVCPEFYNRVSGVPGCAATVTARGLAERLLYSDAYPDAAIPSAARSPNRFAFARWQI